ncbi:MAG TPA: DUF2971 domain-containing protein, partial [Thermodesulfobacteriota bacterium]|nr:DUF2971 domain-containing protein [Thermodesulfobacteriota bacterium]
MKYILPTGTLMFNPFSKVNDPRECKQWDISPFVPMDWKLDLEGYDTIAKQVSDILKSNAKLLCFCRDKDEARGKWQPRALLDRGFARPSMWHHYGNAYDGICFMFDRRRLDSAFKKELDSTRLISGAVSYSDEGIVPNPGNDPFVIDMTRVRNMDDYIHSIVAHHAQWLSKLFLQKLTDWEKECEYRWIYFDR